MSGSRVHIGDRYYVPACSDCDQLEECSLIGCQEKASVQRAVRYDKNTHSIIIDGWRLDVSPRIGRKFMAEVEEGE